MLAGLLFAVRDADDRPDRLVATLPFAGTTLIEYQARLLMAAGASQIVVVAAKLAPDLLGALSRIGRRGVAVDAVRSAAEAAERLHPLSRVLVLADGLVTTSPLLRRLGGDGGDALLVAAEEDAAPSYERIGGRVAWAGAARLRQPRFSDVAAMPRDWDLQSALLRVAAQADAEHLLLHAGALAEGHGVEHRAAALEARSRTILASVMADADGWFDRLMTAPIGRLALPALVARRVPAGGLALAGTAFGAAGLAAIRFDLHAVGLALTLAAVVVWAVGAALADLCDESRSARFQRTAGMLLPALAALLLGQRLLASTGAATAVVTAVGLVTAGGLAERATSGRSRPAFWGGPGAYLFIVLLGTAAGAPLIGLAAAAIYAAATLGLAVELLRRRN